MAWPHVFLVLNILVFVLAHDTLMSLDNIKNIKEKDYKAEHYEVRTKDGYLLELHRIPYQRFKISGPSNRSAVLLMHGLLRDASAFVSLGPEYSIAYNLADAGFDVWLGNARGTRCSRRHIKLNPNLRSDKTKFFDFTYEQIGNYDIASMVDYILLHTKREQIHFIGHGQGATAFMVLNSMRPEYNKKFMSAHFLAPIGYQNYFSNRNLRSRARFTNTILSMTERLGYVELFRTEEPFRSNNANGSAGEKLLHMYDCDPKMCNIADYCTGKVKQKEVCELLGIEEIMSDKILDNLFTIYLPGGASVKQLAHYGQNVQDQAFRRWNYGPSTNLEVYGATLPPIYNLSLIEVPVTMHYSVGDNLVNETDVKAMAADLPNAMVRKVARDTFLHVDFLASDDVKELVTVYVIEEMFRAQNCSDTSGVLDYKIRGGPCINVEDEKSDNHLGLKDAAYPVLLSFHLKMYLLIHISYFLTQSLAKQVC